MIYSFVSQLVFERQMSSKLMCCRMNLHQAHLLEGIEKASLYPPSRIDLRSVVILLVIFSF